MEKPIRILKPLPGMTLTLTVVTRTLILIPVFGVSILMIVSGFREILQGFKFGFISFIPAIFLFVISLRLLIHTFLLKKRKLAQLHYLIYSDRLVIYNHIKGEVLREIHYNTIPELTFHENLDNSGFIVIGPEEPVLAKGGLFKLKWGVNMKDADNMLENLSEVKKEYLFLKGLIEAYQEEEH